MPDIVRVFEIDGIDLEQRKIALAILRRPNLTLDRVPGPQRETPDLGGADIDVVGAWQIVRIRRPQEPKAVWQHLDHTLAGDIDFLGRQFLEDGKHQLLLAHGRGVLDFMLFGKYQQFGGRFGLELAELHILHGGITLWGSRRGRKEEGNNTAAPVGNQRTDWVRRASLPGT